MIKLPELILASASPRRAEILRAVGWPFVVAPADIDETQLPGEDAVAYVERLAQGKAAVIAEKTAALALGADTTVVVDGEILGKPLDADDAARMLRLLSGRWHEVVTGVALAHKDRVSVAHQRTRVRFKALTGDEIAWYVATGEPMDKAGSYAIQGHAALFVEEIQGDYSNIVGLPVQLVYRLAQPFAYSFQEKKFTTETRRHRE